MKSVYQIDTTRIINKEADWHCLHKNWTCDKYEICLEEAIELALENNLDLRVKLWEYEVQEEAMTHARLHMLPNLIFNGYHSFRDKNTGTFAESLVPGVPPAPLSISSQRQSKTWDLTLTWNLLDFGVSYFKAQQEANRLVMKSLDYARAKQNLILDVVKVYWKLAAHTKAASHAEKVLAQSKTVLEKITENVRKGLISPVSGARLSSQILDVQTQIEEDGREHLKYLADFKLLLGLPPDIEVELTCTDYQSLNVELPEIDALEQLALTNRPELYGSDLQEQIAHTEAKAALLQIFPEISPFMGQNFDGNQFLLYHRWFMVGLRTTLNLLAIPGHLSEFDIAELTSDMNRAQRLNLSLGVLTQLHLAYALYKYNEKTFKTAQAFDEQKNILVRYTVELQKYNAIGAVDALINLTDAYRAELLAGMTYAELAASLEQINNSLGLPRYFKDDRENPVEADICPVEEELDHDDFFIYLNDIGES